MDCKAKVMGARFISVKSCHPDDMLKTVWFFPEGQCLDLNGQWNATLLVWL